MGAKLEEIKNGASVRGIASAQPVHVVSVDWIGDQAINVVYRDHNGSVAEAVLYRGQESDSVGVAPASIAPLHADLASAEIPDGLLGRLLGRALGRMDAAGALGARRFYRPALGMFGHVSVGHICLPVRLTLRLQSV